MSSISSDLLLPSFARALATNDLEVVALVLDDQWPEQALFDALCLACEVGHSGAVQLLLDRQTPTSTRHVERNPLVVAARYGHLNVVLTLLAAGADPTVRHSLPLRTAAEYGHTEIFDRLYVVSDPLAALSAQVNTDDVFFPTAASARIQDMIWTRMDADNQRVCLAHAVADNCGRSNISLKSTRQAKM